MKRFIEIRRSEQGFVEVEFWNDDEMVATQIIRAGQIETWIGDWICDKVLPSHKSLEKKCLPRIIDSRIKP